MGGAECVVLAIPSQSFRTVAARLKGHPAILVSVTKGIEFETGDTMSRILREHAPADRVAALSGPSFAREVALGIPTTVVCASESDGTARTVQGLFHRPEFRIYRSTDILGVEYGGALKNIIAIAAGVSDGLGYGDNTKAGLVTRALAEMRRLGVACGAQAETFAGLSGSGRPHVDVFLEAKPQSRPGRTPRDAAKRWRTSRLRIPSWRKAIRRRVRPTGWPGKRKCRRRSLTKFTGCCTRARDREQAVRDLISRTFKAED